MKRIAVIGAGITGLYLALRLSKQHKVTVFESLSAPGGLARCFDIEQTRLELFYHHFFRTDEQLVSLVRELGLEERLLYLRSSIGVHYKEATLPFSTSLDLLRFSRLPISSRIIFGLQVLHLRRKKTWKDLEKVTVKEWMDTHWGSRIYSHIWGPLLKAKFGDYATEISMAWLWGRINPRSASRERGGEKLGYLKGGMCALFESMVERIISQGGIVQYNTQVKYARPSKEGVFIGTGQGEEVFDLCIATTDTHTVADLVQGLKPETVTALRAVSYFGAICMILKMRQPLGDIYWMNNADPELDVSGIIEHTNLVPPAEYEGYHISYVFRYLSTQDDLYSRSNQEIYQRFMRGVHAVYPQFDPEIVAEWFVFRSSKATPVYKGAYSHAKPPLELLTGRIYFAGTASIYPEDRNLNNGIGLAETLLTKLRRDGRLEG